VWIGKGREKSRLSKAEWTWGSPLPSSPSPLALWGISLTDLISHSAVALTATSTHLPPSKDWPLLTAGQLPPSHPPESVLQPILTHRGWHIPF
jgi:hypothetical protein